MLKKKTCSNDLKASSYTPTGLFPISRAMLILVFFPNALRLMINEKWNIWKSNRLPTTGELATSPIPVFFVSLVWKPVKTKVI